jgi:hypothetical protein
MRILLLLFEGYFLVLLQERDGVWGGGFQNLFNRVGQETYCILFLYSRKNHAYTHIHPKLKQHQEMSGEYIADPHFKNFLPFSFVREKEILLGLFH